MILEALKNYYEVLLKKGRVPSFGWGNSKVSFALDINDSGEVIGLYSLKTEQPSGKGTKLLPQMMEVPMPQSRSSGVLANFLCDNSGYLLGVDNKGKPERTQKCWEASRELHLTVLKDISSPDAMALKAFFSSWKPENALSCTMLAADMEELSGGANIIFYHNFKPVLDDAEIRSAWQNRYESQCEGEKMQCLVTGKTSPIPHIHPRIMGVRDAQSSGAALVSFNGPAYESYGKEQNANAPVGEYAAFTYTTALNYLISDREHCAHIGDMTVLCWAKSGESAYQDMAMAGMFGSFGGEMTESLVRSVIGKLTRGEKADLSEAVLDPDEKFYILGLSPNAARLSVRFFLENNYGSFLANVDRHYKRLEIKRPAFDKFETPPLWKLLSETVNQNSRDKAASPQMSGDLLRAIITGGRYPSTLLDNVMLRIRAEHTITSAKAAIIKAYYLRNKNPLCPEEVLTVELNEGASNIPYTLGRMFSILEAIQQSANPSINTTIKDKYFNSASSTPATIFPLLINLAQKHLRKLNKANAVYWDKQFGELSCIVGKSYPARLSLPEQGSFQLGYYHQTQKRYEKKEAATNE